MRDFLISPQLNNSFFIMNYLLWGLGLLIIAFIFSVVCRRVSKAFYQQGAIIKALIPWVIDAGMFIAGIIMLTKAFPRISPGIVLGISLFIFMLRGGGFMATKTKKDKEKKDDTNKKGDK